MVFKVGSLQHAKGFVINKLFEDHRIGGKHIPVHLLKHGYPLQHRGMISSAVSELKTEGIILIQPKRTGRSTSDHAVLVWNKLPGARGLLNGYREAADLQRVKKDLKTFLPLDSGLTQLKNRKCTY